MLANDFILSFKIVGFLNDELRIKSDSLSYEFLYNKVSRNQRIIMFKATVYSSRFRAMMKHYLKLVLVNNDSIQIVHKGESEPIRVLITQEHYLNLLSKVSLYEAQLGIAPVEKGTVRDSNEATRLRLEKRRAKLDKDMKEFGETLEPIIHFKPKAPVNQKKKYRNSSKE